MCLDSDGRLGTGVAHVVVFFLCKRHCHHFGALQHICSYAGHVGSCDQPSGVLVYGGQGRFSLAHREALAFYTALIELYLGPVVSMPVGYAMEVVFATVSKQ